MKKNYLILIGIITILSIRGFTQTVSNISTRTVKGKIVIDYEVDGFDENHSAFVKIFYSTDKKKYFLLLDNVEGDVNKEITTNGKKSAVWNPVAQKEKFDEKVRFKIELDVNKTEKVDAITSKFISSSWKVNNLVLYIELSTTNNINLLFSLEDDHFIVDNYGNKFPIKKIFNNNTYIGKLNSSLILNTNSNQIISLHVKTGKSRIRFVSSVNVFDKLGNLITRVAPFTVP